MLHGQSAGAQDAWTLATLPEAPELFSAGTYESGAGVDTTTGNNAQKIGEAYAKALNCSSSNVSCPSHCGAGLADSRIQPSCLRAASVQDLVAKLKDLPILNTGYGNFPGLEINSIEAISLGPSVDGDLIKVQPSEAGVQVPSVMGYSQPCSLFRHGHR